MMPVAKILDAEGFEPGDDFRVNVLFFRSRPRRKNFPSFYFVFIKIMSKENFSGEAERLSHTTAAIRQKADDEYEKEDARDFALWKVAKEGEPDSALWDTELGRGRPG